MTKVYCKNEECENYTTDGDICFNEEEHTANTCDCEYECAVCDID